MERGGSSKRQHKHVNPRSSSGVVIREAGSNRNNNHEVNNPDNINTDHHHQQQPWRRGNDQYMPIANVIRIMRKILPPHAKIADDAKETVQECVSEFISFVTSEANERCQREQRKTVNAEDLLWAMGKLGFDNYVEPLTLYLNKYRQHETERTSVRGEPIVMRTIDFGHGQQLLSQPQPQPQPQMALPPVLNYPPGFSMAAHHTAAAMSSYYMNPNSDGQASSSSSNAVYGLPGFDPNAHFK